MLKNDSANNKTLRGGASMYVVIFMTLVLGIISFSYVRVMLSNATQTTNTDLSQSAYDSAMAGLEDAKVALLKYHDCISRGYSNSSSGSGTPDLCGNVIREMEQGIASQSCDVVKNVLQRIVQGDQGETMIEETNGNGIGDNSSLKMDQAYTCVRIAEDLKDYRSTLSESSRIRIVPLRSAEYAQVKKIRVSWYSDINAQVNNDSNYSRASMIGLDIFQTGNKGFNLGELSTSNDGRGNADGKNSTVDLIGTDHAKIFLKTGNRTTTIEPQEFIKASDKSQNTVLEGKCATGSDTVNGPEFNGFACYADIRLPNTYYNEPRSEATFFLRLTLPYGYPTTDFAINLCKTDKCSVNGSDDVYEFTGVQSLIDSTGRANDLYRRVETRIELVDNYFPYPEFALQIEGNSEHGLEKNFWVTKNCWGSNNGELFTCSNQSEL